MTHYTRFWNCETCGERVESISWPKEFECEPCERKRLRREFHRDPGKIADALQGSWNSIRFEEAVWAAEKRLRSQAAQEQAA